MASAEGTAQIDLDAAVLSGDDDWIARVLDDIARRGASAAGLNRIMKLARETRSPVVRNAAALALADLNVDGVDELLIDLIKRTETRSANGTLLYALREMNAYVPLPVLIDLISEERTYEALEGALDLIANNAARYTREEKAEAVTRLQPLSTATETHTAHPAKLAIKYLTRQRGKQRGQAVCTHQPDPLEAWVDESIERSQSRGYHPSVFISMRKRHGTVAAMEQLVGSGEIQSGFIRLKKLDMAKEWSVEAGILKFS
jgi:hypothetical protein